MKKDLARFAQKENRKLGCSDENLTAESDR